MKDKRTTLFSFRNWELQSVTKAQSAITRVPTFYQKQIDTPPTACDLSTSVMKAQAAIAETPAFFKGSATYLPKS